MAFHDIRLRRPSLKALGVNAANEMKSQDQKWFEAIHRLLHPQTLTLIGHLSGQIKIGDEKAVMLEKPHPVVLGAASTAIALFLSVNSLMLPINPPDVMVGSYAYEARYVVKDWQHRAPRDLFRLYNDSYSNTLTDSTILLCVALENLVHLTPEQCHWLKEYQNNECETLGKVEFFFTPLLSPQVALPKHPHSEICHVRFDRQGKPWLALDDLDVGPFMTMAGYKTPSEDSC